MNALGGGPAKAGAYFPQDEFYDAFMQDAMAELAKRARTNAHIASETPAVAAYYAQRANRTDLICVELSDPAELEKLTPGDFVIDARGPHLLHQSGNVDASARGRRICVHDCRRRHARPPKFTFWINIRLMPCVGAVSIRSPRVSEGIIRTEPSLTVGLLKKFLCHSIHFLLNRSLNSKSVSSIARARFPKAG